MGTYMHRYKQVKAATQKQWAKIKADVEKLLLTLPPVSESAGGKFSHFTLMIANAAGVPGTLPVVTDDEIALNGVEGKIDLAHESLWITRAKNTVPDADYCRTARKPYDIVVCGVLLVLQHHAPGVWDISTDGTLEDWDPAREWVEGVLGFPGFDEVMSICQNGTNISAAVAS